MMHSFFATCPQGMETLLLQELIDLGATSAKETRAGVHFSGTLITAYRGCLWSRLASRILMPLGQFPPDGAQALYEGTQQVQWSEHISPQGTLAVDYVGGANTQINHSHYGALKIKDAIVDQLRARHGVRPDVSLNQPDVRIYAHDDGRQVTLGIDLSGESLHRRGYRQQGGAAPLKENLACAILLRAAWPRIAANQGALVDIMCGSGTFLIEGAFMAADIAPGIQRFYFGFLGWLGHDGALWQSLLQEAHGRKQAGLLRLPPILGFDEEAKAVSMARENIAKAGLGGGYIKVEQRALSHTQAPAVAPGLVVLNPPYGHRLGDEQQLAQLYGDIGEQLKTHFLHYHAAVFTGSPELGKYIKIRARRIHKLFNGPLKCALYQFELEQRWFAQVAATAAELEAPQVLSAGAQMFANRLAKNLKHYGHWAKRQDIDCYRLYDADMPEYNVAVDLYQGEQTQVHVQEYAAPNSVDLQKSKQRLKEIMAAIPQVLQVFPTQIHYKIRQRQKDHSQYEKLATEGAFYAVKEGHCRFWVNFSDYVDTGLFLDQRLTRAMIGAQAQGKDFLNLFSYTGSASVYAALGGANSTTSVDMSHTYSDWAQRNFSLNKLAGSHHRFIQADVLRWLEQPEVRRYDLIFLDPPTFSRSKRMDQHFDVQRDHGPLILRAMQYLKPGGVLIFSSNFSKFKLDYAVLSQLQIEDISAQTVPKDFEHHPKIHVCFSLRWRPVEENQSLK